MESILLKIQKRVECVRHGVEMAQTVVHAPVITPVSGVFRFGRIVDCSHPPQLSACAAQDLKLENICFCEKSPSSTHVKASRSRGF